jgi:carbamoyltransferase
MASTYVLAISASYYGSAPCPLRDGEIFAAAPESRLTRRKGDNSFPAHAAGWCLNGAENTTADLASLRVTDTRGLRLNR